MAPPAADRSMGPCPIGRTTRQDEGTTMKKSTTLLSTAAAAGALAFGAAGVLGQSATAASSAVPPDASFVMARSADRAGDRLPAGREGHGEDHQARQRRGDGGTAKGLAPSTEYDLFVIQGRTRRSGCPGTRATWRTTGRRRPWHVPRPVQRGDLHGRPGGDRGSRRARLARSRTRRSNPATAPVHQYHLGLWFNDPAAAGGGGLRQRRDAVQRRPQRGRAGPQHPPVPGAQRAAAQGAQLTRSRGMACPAGRHDRPGTRGDHFVAAWALLA